MLKKYSYVLKNLDCAVCAAKIENEIKKNKAFSNVRVNFNTLKLTFEADNNKNIQKQVKKLEPEVEVLDVNETITTDNKTKTALFRLVIAIVLALISSYVKLPKIISETILIIAYILLLSRTVKNAFKLFKSSHNIDENFLITISCIGAYLVGEHMEGLMVIVLYEIGKILEEKAVNKTRKSINDLMNIKPEYANVLKDEEIKKYFDAEIQFNVMIADVNKIIAEAVKDVL